MYYWDGGLMFPVIHGILKSGTFYKFLTRYSESSLRVFSVCSTY